MSKTPADRIATAQAAFEAGFLSMAAKKRAQEDNPETMLEPRS